MEPQKGTKGFTAKFEADTRLQNSKILVQLGFIAESGDFPDLVRIRGGE